MLKKFFISMLGTMAGLWLSLIIFVVGSFVVATVLMAKMMTKDQIADNNILYIRLDGSIPDRMSDMSTLDMLQSSDVQSDGLDDIIASITLSADDSKIKGIYLDCRGSSLGLASRSEVVAAIEQFKKSGKWVYAYSDNYTQGDYYIATAADEVYLNPVGMVEVKGLSTTIMFYKDILEKLGVEVQVVKVGQYKSAVEPFTRMDMSEASYEQTKEYVDQLWNCMSYKIASNRRVEQRQVCDWADSIAFTWAPQKYVDSKIVDQLKYRSEIEEMLRNKLSLKETVELPFVTPTDYMSAKDITNNVSDKKHIAVLYAVGDIVESGSSGIVSDKLVPEISKLAKDDKVIGMVMRVNSGGGSAFASEQIWHALEEFKATGKPFYVSMGDYAASGGYYISSGANEIYADSTTLTGSIGIFGLIPNASQLITKKIGLGLQTVQTNPNSNFPTFFKAGTPEQLEAMQSHVDRGYETFTSRVAAGRDLPIDSVKAIGGGRVWTGMVALNIGLVDKLGSLDDAVLAMANKLDVKPTDYVEYPIAKEKYLDMLVKLASENSDMRVEALPSNEMIEILKTAASISTLSPLQARMPYSIVY